MNRACVASVLTGLAIVSNGVPAHAMFMFLNQTASHTVPGAPRADAKATTQTGAVMRTQAAVPVPAGNQTAGLGDAGTQPQSASDEVDSSVASYDSLSSRFDRSRFTYWWNPSGGSIFESVLHQHRGAGGLQAPIANAPLPAKSSPPVGVPVPPSADPIDEIVAPVAQQPDAPVWNDPPPIVDQPVTGDIDPDDADVIGSPPHTVPEPSTVGLLGMGLLLTFFANARRSRARRNPRIDMKTAHAAVR